jgi:hypothetical protein
VLSNLLRTLGLPAMVVVLLLIVVAAQLARAPGPRLRPPPDAAFRLMGPAGKYVGVQPQLAKIPPLDFAVACAKVKAHNAKARELERSAPDDHDDDPSRTVHRAAEAGCTNSAERASAFYDELSDVLNSGSSASRFGAEQLLAATREALRAAPSADDVGVTLRGLDTRATYLAEPLHEPDFYLIGAEAMAAHVILCAGKDAPSCRRKSHSARGRDLFDAGRWRADAELLRASIAAYREALRDAAAKSKNWVELHTLIGSALAQLSEQVETPARAGLLREALAEYEEASTAVRPDAEWTWR